jgi:transglutaminase-like putative cysteine protease
MKFALRYQTEYRYSGPVFDQHNSLRVKPASGPLQRVRHFRVAVDPSARTRTYRDYFGTEVIDFNVAGEHERLAITADGEVTTEAPPEPPAGGWERARGEEYTTAGGEFLLRTSDEPPNGTLDSLIRDVRGSDPRATLEAVCELIPDRFEYSPGVTFVGSTVDDLLEGGAGVCQDFVHLALILLRRHGIAARYVSGYLFAAPEDGGTDSVEAEPHDSAPVLRVRRMLADMDFRARVSPGPDAVSPQLHPIQQELERLDAEIHDRFFHPSPCPRQDRPRPVLRRRPPDQGRLPRSRRRGRP